MLAVTLLMAWTNSAEAQRVVVPTPQYYLPANGFVELDNSATIGYTDDTLIPAARYLAERLGAKYSGDAEADALVDFYADWCGPCRMMAPILEAVAAEKEDLLVAKVNVDENAELASRYGVMSIPTLVILEDGEEIKRIVGARPKEALLSEIEE